MDKEKKILVIGAKGMLGSTVYKYLRQIYPNTFGTDRNKDKKYFLLLAESFQTNLKQVLKKTINIDYIINCIGALPNDLDKKKVSYVNSLFPKKLAYFAERSSCHVAIIFP